MLQGHCSGRIAVRIGFAVAEEILRKSVNVSTLLTFLEDFESAVFIAAAVGQLQHGVGTPIDVCTLFSTKHNVFVRVEVYNGLPVQHCQESWC